MKTRKLPVLRERVPRFCEKARKSGFPTDESGHRHGVVASKNAERARPAKRQAEQFVQISHQIAIYTSQNTRQSSFQHKKSGHLCAYSQRMRTFGTQFVCDTANRYLSCPAKRAPIAPRRHISTLHSSHNRTPSRQQQNKKASYHTQSYHNEDDQEAPCFRSP